MNKKMEHKILVLTPYKINCWFLAYLRKSSRTFLVCVLFTKFPAYNTQLILYKNVIKNEKNLNSNINNNIYFLC